MRRQQALLCASAAGLAVGLHVASAQAHSRRISYGPTTPSLAGVAPSDGVSPRLFLRHRTAEGAGLEADPVTISDAATGRPFAEHLHGTPLLASGLSLRTELVLDAPTVCAASTSQAARYRLRDIANGLRHTFSPGERVAVTLLESGREPVRLQPTDQPSDALAWLAASCAARPATSAVPPFDRHGFKQLRAAQPSSGTEAVIWLLVVAGAEARLFAGDAPLLADTGVGLLESFTPPPATATLTPAAERQPGTFQTDPIVAELKGIGVRTEPESGSGWSPFCTALATEGGSCLLGGLMAGANAMTTQRLLAEGQALFVTPMSCLPEQVESVAIATVTGKVVVPATRLAGARCVSWQAPLQATASTSPTAWMAAAVALLVAGAAALFLRRRRGAGASVARS